MPTATSGSYDYATDRDKIITRALRIIGAVGQGETAPTAAITEGAEALNDLCKEWEADGMPLWAIRSYTLTPTATATYAVGVGATLNAAAPLKVIDAWTRVTATNQDTPLLIVTRDEYQMNSNKAQTGTPTQLWYNPPGDAGAGNESGTITLYPVPDTAFIAGSTILLIGQRPFQDFDASADIADFPKYWYNAVKWGLADQLCYEYGVGLSERAMINKKAMWHKMQALSFGTEEGHLLIQPSAGYWGSY